MPLANLHELFYTIVDCVDAILQLLEVHFRVNESLLVVLLRLILLFSLRVARTMVKVEPLEAEYVLLRGGGELCEVYRLT